jgi:tellurite resistance protein TerC
MLIDVFKIPVVISLLTVVGILAITMIWSVKTSPKEEKAN